MNRFESFLRKYNVWDTFVENFNKVLRGEIEPGDEDVLKYSSIEEYIDDYTSNLNMEGLLVLDAFNWSATEQKGFYWDDINDLWEVHLDNNYYGEEI